MISGYRNNLNNSSCVCPNLNFRAKKSAIAEESPIDKIARRLLCNIIYLFPISFPKITVNLGKMYLRGKECVDNCESNEYKVLPIEGSSVIEGLKSLGKCCESKESCGNAPFYCDCEKNLLRTDCLYYLLFIVLVIWLAFQCYGGFVQSPLTLNF